MVSILEASDGSLWFGTEVGVSRYDGANWYSLTQEDGLAGNDVYSILEASDGSLWFSAALKLV